MCLVINMGGSNLNETLKLRRLENKFVYDINNLFKEYDLLLRIPTELRPSYPGNHHRLLDNLNQVDQDIFALKNQVVQTLPQNSDARRHLHNQIDEVSKLKRENLHLVRINKELTHRCKILEQEGKQNQRNCWRKCDLVVRGSLIKQAMLYEKNQQLNQLTIQQLKQDNHSLQIQLQNLNQNENRSNQQTCCYRCMEPRKPIQNLNQEVKVSEEKNNFNRDKPTSSCKPSEEHWNIQNTINQEIDKGPHDYKHNLEGCGSTSNPEVDLDILEGLETIKDSSYIRRSLENISQVMKDTEILEKEVERFFRTKEKKKFLDLKEQLIRNVVKLDNVETQGHFVIRKKRKDVIQFVQSILNKLTNKEN